MLSIICFFKTIYRTITSYWLFEGVYISGHDFIEQEDMSLKCEICGKVSN